MAGKPYSVIPDRKARQRFGQRLTKKLKDSPLLWEIKKTTLLTTPLVMAQFLQYTIPLVSLAFSGNVDKDSAFVLEVVGFGLCLFDTFWLVVALGFASALDTLASQAWGAENYKKLGVYLQRGMLTSILVMCFLLAVLLNTESILNFLYQSSGEHTAFFVAVGQHAQVLCCCIPAVFYYILLQRYLQAQNITYPFIITGIIVNIVNPLAHYLFLFVARWGVRGAAGAVVLSWYTYLISLLIIIYVRKLHVKTWGGWSRECLKDWGQFLFYAIPGVFFVLGEGSGIAAGYFLLLVKGRIHQSSYALAHNIINIPYWVAFSIGVAISIRVGNELGRGSIKQAKYAILVGGSYILALGIFIAVLFTSLKDYIPEIFTTDEGILQAMAPIMYLLVILTPPDCFQNITSGVIRGVGKQHIGAAISIFCHSFVEIGVGSMMLFAFDLGSFGYIIGLLTANIMACLLETAMISAINWKKEKEKAQRIADKHVVHTNGKSRPGPSVKEEKSKKVSNNIENGLSNQILKSLCSKKKTNLKCLSTSQLAVRSVVMVIFFLLFVCGLLLSQLLVYRCHDVPEAATLNASNVTNVTTSYYFDIRNGTCSWWSPTFGYE